MEELAVCNCRFSVCPTAEIEAAKNDMDPKSFAQDTWPALRTCPGAFTTRSIVTSCKTASVQPSVAYMGRAGLQIDPMSSVILQPQPNGELWAMMNWCSFPLTRQKFVMSLRDVLALEITGNGISRSGRCLSPHARGESDVDIFKEKGFLRVDIRKSTRQLRIVLMLLTEC